MAHSVPGEHNDALDFDRVKIDAIEIFFSQNHASAGPFAAVETPTALIPELVALCQIVSTTSFLLVSAGGFYQTDDLIRALQ